MAAILVVKYCLRSVAQRVRLFYENAKIKFLRSDVVIVSHRSLQASFRQLSIGANTIMTTKMAVMKQT